MNTRLQVEHPVTEAITGLDLVEWQIRVACGEKLARSQKEIARRGWAIEVRVNAEDPASDFLPQAGTILRWRADPSESIRIDSGFAEGSVISPHYDSLLAKIIAHGPDRTTASRRLARALRTTEILGLPHNQDFLADIIASEAFEHEVLTTRFLAEHFENGWSPAPPPDELFTAAASAFMPKNILTGFRSTLDAGRSLFRVKWRDQAKSVVVDRDSGAFVAIPESGSRNVHLFALGKAWVFEVTSELDALAELAGKAADAGEREIRAPMPGIISTLDAEIGQTVVQGQTLAVLEAMKLLHSIAAPRSGVITAIFCVEGAAVSGKQILFHLTSEETPG
jgi:acetyl/propionyl-CoA carboxylase alpha subunit